MNNKEKKVQELFYLIKSLEKEDINKLIEEISDANDKKLESLSNSFSSILFTIKSEKISHITLEIQKIITQTSQD